MSIRVLAFARLRELLGAACELQLPAGSTAGDLWETLAASCTDLRGLASSTRIARNGRLVTSSEVLAEGDEIALLPPVGGG